MSEGPTPGGDESGSGGQPLWRCAVSWVPFSRLPFRMMVMFGIVLMPLALLSYVQIRQYQEEAAARGEAAVLGATLQAALPLIDRITRSEGAVAGLAAMVAPVASDPATCTLLLRRFLAEPKNRDYTFAGYVPRSLRMDCSPQGARDLTGSADAIRLMDAGVPVVRVNPHGAISGKSVLVFSHPVRDSMGRVQGLVSLSVPHDSLEEAGTRVTQGQGPDPDFSLMMVNTSGQVLTASTGLDGAETRLPAGRELTEVLKSGAGSFRGTSREGEPRIYAVVPLRSSGLFMLGDWPVTETDARIFDTSLPTLAFPALMWLASLLVAQLAAEHQVLRHIRSLRDSITAFANGNRRLPDLDLPGASVELRSVGNAFERMMESVLHDEADLEDMIHQKEVLLREVHHRVKNNLQLIASIINMQIRKARSPESRGLLKSLQDRVMSLATIHRELYQTTGGSDVRADELLQNILNQIMKMAARPGEPFRVTADLEDIRLPPDQAVPLSLLVTEALTNALKYASAPEGEVPELRLRLARDNDGRAEIVIVNSATHGVPRSDPALDDATEGAGLGEALVRAFAGQLGTAVERRHENGEYTLSFHFTPLALADGEERLSL